MSNSTPETARAGRRPEARRVHALTAEDAGPPEQSCVVGELVRVSDLCDDQPCRCEWAFNGVATDGATTIAAVRELRGVGRSDLRRALIDRMARCGCAPAMARSRVDRLLDLAASLPEGTLLRLERGVPVPFPPGSRMRGRGTVIVPGPGCGQ